MKVIQQLYSKTGNFRVQELDVQKIQKMDNVLLKFTKHSSVIWVNNKQYPIIFRNSELRDKVFGLLVNIFTIEKIPYYTIDLESFYNNVIPIEQLYSLLTVDNYSMSKYLFGVGQQLMSERKCSFNDLKTLDAFNNLSNNQFKNIQHKVKQTFSHEQINIFSRSLRYPKKFHELVTPLTFWTTLSKL